MTTTDAIEAAIAQGRGIAATVLGRTFTIYRPADPLAPMNNPRGLMKCLFTPQPDAYYRPNLPAQPWWYGEYDTRLMQCGDIAAGAAGTWFVFAQQQYTAPICVQANRTVSVLLPQTNFADGLNGYGGSTIANETTVLAGWPASILLGTKGERAAMTLPGDTRLPWVAIILPPTLDVIIPHGAIITDEIGRRFTVSGAELTDGWRITAQQELT
jgi:hypothetical protein